MYLLPAFLSLHTISPFAGLELGDSLVGASRTFSHKIAIRLANAFGKWIPNVIEASDCKPAEENECEKVEVSRSVERNVSARVTRKTS